MPLTDRKTEVISRVPVQPAQGMNDVSMFEFPRIHDRRGNLTFIEGLTHLPYEIRRVYYLYDVPAGAMRGGHAHKQLQQCLIPISGSFTVIIDNGRSRERFFLNRPYCGLYIPSMIWRELEDFSSGSICLVLASEEYHESDYYRSYGEYLAALRDEGSSSISRPACNLHRTAEGN
jgi:dTDP-4-dehydrorhamnose 3,5-epimerase-like enzyme